MVNIKWNKIAAYLSLLLLAIIWSACGRKDDFTIPTPTPTSDVIYTPTCTPTYIVAPTIAPTATEMPKKVVCIDPGHQAKGNLDYEPIGPDSTERKYKVTGGTVGVVTKKPEYELTLEVSLLLKSELESRGYSVVMTRTENDVDISNMERALIAIEEGADIFVRIHANSSNTTIKGAMTICQTTKNPYNGELYKPSKLLSQCILDGIIAATEAENRGVWETDTMSGINWSSVPVTIIEMGYLSDPEEDVLLSDAEYQLKMVRGIADGIDLYFVEIEND